MTDTQILDFIQLHQPFVEPFDVGVNETEWQAMLIEEDTGKVFSARDKDVRVAVTNLKENLEKGVVEETVFDKAMSEESEG